jgi:hypothetical protein
MAISSILGDLHSLLCTSAHIPGGPHPLSSHLRIGVAAPILVPVEFTSPEPSLRSPSAVIWNPKATAISDWPALDPMGYSFRRHQPSPPRDAKQVGHSVRGHQLLLLVGYPKPFDPAPILMFSSGCRNQSKG